MTMLTSLTADAGVTVATTSVAIVIFWILQGLFGNVFVMPVFTELLENAMDTAVSVASADDVPQLAVTVYVPGLLNFVENDGPAPVAGVPAPPVVHLTFFRFVPCAANRCATPTQVVFVAGVTPVTLHGGALGLGLGATSGSRSATAVFAIRGQSNPSA